MMGTHARVTVVAQRVSWSVIGNARISQTLALSVNANLVGMAATALCGVVKVFAMEPGDVLLMVSVYAHSHTLGQGAA